MRSLLLAAFVIPVLLFPAFAQPPLTPRVTLPMHRTRVIVPERFRGLFPEETWVWVPQGWGVKIFHAGSVVAPRFLAWGPDSVLHVANRGAGNVLALPDRNRDGVADIARIVADSVEAHDIEFFRGAMYAAEETRVLELVDADGDGYYERRSVFIDSLPAGGHTTRTIVFDTLRNVVYISVGSSCNACRDSVQAVVYAFGLDGAGRRIFASGVRNAVGMTQHPLTGQLWATNNGQDWQGDDIPPEWISIVRDGGFYGYPIAYSDGRYFDFTINEQYQGLLPITADDSALVRSMLPSSAEVTAHAAPMAIEFADASMPQPYRNGAFVALHGSWNRSVPSGYKLVHLAFDGPTDSIANTVSYVLAGDTAEYMSPVYSMRPCGLETDRHGNLYFTSDHATSIVGILYSQPLPGATEEPAASSGVLTITPNPVTSSATIAFELVAPSACTLELFDARGLRVMKIADERLSGGMHRYRLDTRSLPSGTYSVRLSIDGRDENASIVVQH
jgi:glucose/arabinose dehydrogenase